MKIALGSDHAGFDLKQGLRTFLEDRGHQVVDVGTTDNETSVDYPIFAFRVADLVRTKEVERGILVCGTGIGMSIAANKVPGIRAANAWDVSTAMLAAKHNKANILTLGGRLMALERGIELVYTWLNTPFEDRHQHRLDLVTAIEQGKEPG